MDINDVRQRFEAYRAGTADAAALRQAVQAGIAAAPHLAASYGALVSAYVRSAVVDAALGSELAAAIDAAAAPGPAASKGPARDSGPEQRTRFVAQRDSAPLGAADASGDSSLPRIIAEPLGASARDAASAPAAGPATGSTTGGTTGSTGGSAWDTPERLAEAAAPLSVESVLKRRFELVSELGRGGMGVVYKAIDRAQSEFKDRNPFVAIKVLGEEFRRHPLAVRSLQREARKAQKLAHPNIVTVHDFDRDGGNVFMVMELLEGKPLDSILRSDTISGLPVEQVATYLVELGAALSYAHEQGIVHCDFKPSNAFVTVQGPIKVLDFGIARARRTRGGGEDKTMFDVSELGAVSPPYASPQMLRGEEPEPRDDLYSLACVTYEMLSGRHPFNRIDALKAREAGLQPAPVKGLRRAQWAALRSALMFEREQRPASIGAFVDSFVTRPKSRAWLLPAAVVAAVAVAAALVVPGQWDAIRARRLAGAVAEATPANFDAAYSQLTAASPAVRNLALQSDGARRQLIAHFQSEIDAHVAPPRFEYAAARKRLRELSALLPDSSVVAGMAQHFDDASKVELLHQLELRDRMLEQGLLVAAKGEESATAVLERIRQIDPAHPALSDPRLPAIYSAGARSALDRGDPALAATTVDAGLVYAPTDPRLLDLKDRVESEQRRAENLKRAGEIEQRLSALDPAAADFVEKALAQRDDITALLSAAPDSATAKRLQAGLDAAVAARVKQRLATDDIAGAQDLLQNAGDLLPEASLESLRAAVLERAKLQEARSLDTLDRLRRATLTGRISQTGSSGALDLYSDLQRAGASPDVLAEARDFVAYGYLRESRRARLAGDLGAANKKLQAAAALRPGSLVQSMVDAERGVLDARSAGAADAGKGADLDAARGRFASALQAEKLGPTEIAAMAASLDRLESIGSSAQEVNSGLRQVEDRVLGELSRLGKSGPEQARLLAQQASVSLPASDRLADAARQLRSSASREADQTASPELGKLQAELKTLLAKPEPTDQWAGELRRILQKSAAFAPASDPAFVDARRVAIATFVGAASAARSKHRFSEASALLGQASTIEPSAPELGAERQAIERDRAAADAEAAKEEQKANVDAVKQRLADQAQAGDVAGATQTANALRRVMAGSLYVAHDLPQQMSKAYAQRARSQLFAGHVDEALKTIADGRQKYGSSPELKNLELRYIVVGDAYDRISTAINLNVAEQRRFGDTMRAAEGADYPAIERMLAQVLANRIADQRAANRPAVVTALLDAGRKVFPEYADTLERGTPGALPNTPLAVSGEDGAAPRPSRP